MTYTDIYMIDLDWLFSIKKPPFGDLGDQIASGAGLDSVPGTSCHETVARRLSIQRRTPPIMKPTRHSLLAWGCLWLAQAIASAGPVELENEKMLLRFDPGDGYALSGLVNGAHDVDFIRPRPVGVEQDRSPWLLHVRGPRVNHTLSAANAQAATHSIAGDTLTITWSGIASEEMPGGLTVTATVRLPRGSAKAYWRAEVSGKTRGALWQLDFPRMTGIRDFPDCQMSQPYYWGRRVRRPMQLGRQLTMVYPEPASMQWFALWGSEDKREPLLAEAEGYTPESGWAPDRSDACGLYWAAEDGRVFLKRFACDPTLEGEQLAWHIENVPGLPTWPLPILDGPVPVHYEMPYDVAIAVFTGDWLDGAQIYRDWAERQEWTQRGAIDRWPADMPAPGSAELARWTPPWFRRIGFWAKFYHEPAKVLPEWAAYRKWLRVPAASHWYRYNIAAFNDNDPEHLPPDPYLLDGARAAREMGVEPMPYVLSTIWDRDTQSWIREDGQRSALRTEAGEIPEWKIGENDFARMCLSQEQWHARMREICRKLIWEHGMSGVYLDVLAAGAAWPCYDPNHGHPVHGGDYWGQGARKMMADLRADIRRLDPDACFFTEEIGEHLIDVMDGFLTLDLTRSHTPGGEQVWPILAGVYHPHTINFGSDAEIGMDPDRFAVLYGRQLVWGSQPLHSTMKPPVPKAGDTTAEMFRDYTQAHWVAAQPFLTGGKMLRLATRPPDAPPGKCGLELATEPHTVRYELLKNRRKIWTGPAVLASAWERFGDIGIVMANISGSPRSVDFTIRGQALGLTGEKLVRLWPGEAAAVGTATGEHRLTLPPYRTAVYCLTADPGAAMARLNPLDDTPWEFESVAEGPIPSVRAKPGTLFACSGGLVKHRNSASGVEATAWACQPDGACEPRTGRQAALRGAAAEGHGLPRDLDRKPFSLFRRLPHKLTSTDGDATVFSGDENHLLVKVEGGTRIDLAAPGIVVTDRGGVEVAASVRVPAGENSLVGWARFEPDEMATLLPFGDDGIRDRVQPLADRLIALRKAKPGEIDEELAAASRQFVEVAESFSDLPGMLSPVSPLTRLGERINALVAAKVDGTMALTTEHRWLAAGLDKELTLMLRNGLDDKARIIPIGSWRKGTFSVGPPSAPNPVGENTLRQTFSVRLDDGLYVERAIPVLGVAEVEKGGHRFALTDLLRLEANRPYQVLYSPAASTVVAGKTCRVKFIVRNWSPLDLTLQIGGTGPARWTVVPAMRSIAAPKLSDTPFTVDVAPPADAATGRREIRVFTSHAPGEDKSFLCLPQVEVIDNLAPLLPDAQSWPRPNTEERSRIRQRGTFAIYAEAGEPIEATIQNVRVSLYVDTLTWQLLGPQLTELAKGRIPVDKSATASQVARSTGTHYLKVSPDQGSADVTFSNRPVAELATKSEPLVLFTSQVTRYFFVPEGAREFQLAAQDGGPSETARFVITSPTGRVALEANGNFHGTPSPVAVQSGESGKVWEIRVEPRQDLRFWLTGDALPYLSTSVERVLVRVSGRNSEKDPQNE